MKEAKTYKVIKKFSDKENIGLIPKRFEERDIKDCRIIRPTLLCLGGNQTKFDYQANVYCNIAEGIAGIYGQIGSEQFSFNDIDVYSIAYGVAEESDYPNTPTFLSIEEIEEIADNMFVPLVLDSNGAKLDINEARKNCNNATIFLHCYGSVVLNSLIIYLQDVMQTAGYTDVDIQSILNEITCVAYAPYNPIYLLPTLEVKTFEDFTVMDWLKCGLYKKGVNGLKFVQSNDNTLTLWSSRLANGDDQEKDPLVDKLFNAAEKINGIKVKYDEHSPVIINRNNHWQLSTKEGSHYAGCNADAASQVVGYTLASSLANSIQNKFSKGFRPKPSLEEVRAVGLDIISSFNAEDLMYKDDF